MIGHRTMRMWNLFSELVKAWESKFANKGLTGRCSYFFGEGNGGLTSVTIRDGFWVILKIKNATLKRLNDEYIERLDEYADALEAALPKMIIAKALRESDRNSRY